VLEEQLTPVLLQILCGGTGLALWRNQSGHATYKTASSEYHVDYGVGNPPGGGGDYIGVYQGRYVEVEMKSRTGRHETLQRRREQVVARLGGIYAVVRNETDARALLARLRSAAPSQEEQ
jgi:hypothetical protein